MDGYTVDEAASVLGIPPGRVWELLARGVLSGTPEGQTGMRVFLKDRTELAASKEGERRGGNGDVEMSPFRELLGEFRSLTERYGQALLALGEARGEVASLRTRVELLETRVDMGLPSTRRINTVAWELSDAAEQRERARHDAAAPQPPTTAEEAPPEDAAPEVATAEEPAADEPAGERPDVSEKSVQAVQASDGRTAVSEAGESEQATAEPADSAEPAAPSFANDQPAPLPVADAAPAEDVVPDAPGRRVRSARITGLGSFAEALARAQDPTLSQLPGASEAGEALAELQREIAAQPAEASTSDEPEAAEPAADDLTDALAPPEPPAADADASFAPEMEAPVPDAMDEELEDLPQPVSAEAVGLGEIAIDEVEFSVEAGAPPETVPETQPEQAGEAPHSPYSAEVVEPDWFADGDFTWLDAAEAEATEEQASEPEAAASPPPGAMADTEPVEPEHEDASADAEALSPDAGWPAETPQDAPLTDAAEPTLAQEPPAEPEPSPATQPFGGFRAPREEPTALGPVDQPEEELMVLGDEFEASSLEASGAGWRAGTPRDDIGANPLPTSAAGEPPPQPDRGVRAQVLELSDRELERLASDEGWEVEEVQAIRTFLGRPEAHEPEVTEPEITEPEATETEAPEADVRAGAKPDSVEPPPTPSEPPAAAASRQSQFAPPPYPRPGNPGDADWLHGRRGPAANAYRRLRRLFPG
jgi:hypothetical protein